VRSRASHPNACLDGAWRFRRENEKTPMKIATFECKILTPMFAGTAIPGECELRPPAIKGAIRFWWRALHGGTDWKGMREKEAAIFGTSDQAVGRSKFTIDLSEDLDSGYPDFKKLDWGKMVPAGHLHHKINVLDYLAYGHHEWDKENSRYKYLSKCFWPGQDFSLNISYREDIDMDQVWRAIYFWTYFSGLGSRNRNGLGKIWITKWPDEISIPALKFPKPALRPYTAFSNKTAYFETQGLDQWDWALGEIGGIYREVRRGLEKRKVFASRVVLSQPLMEFDFATKQSNPADEMFLERHAKSLFMGVRPDGDKFKGQLLVMPYLYLGNANTPDIKKKLKDRDLKKDQDKYEEVYQKLISTLNSDFKGQLNKVEL
jgi:CRISPR-associated protein Cmr1